MFRLRVCHKKNALTHLPQTSQTTQSLLRYFKVLFKLITIKYRAKLAEFIVN